VIEGEQVPRLRLPVRRMVAFVYMINVLAASSAQNWVNGPYPGSHDIHRSTATTAGKFRAFFDPSQRPIRGEAEQQLKQGSMA
jgi:hypothetical protein